MHRLSMPILPSRDSDQRLENWLKMLDDPSGADAFASSAPSTRIDAMLRYESSPCVQHGCGSRLA